MTKDWRIEIDSEHLNGNASAVFYKGEKVGMLKGIEFKLEAGQPATVTFTVYNVSVEIANKEIIPKEESL
jgi:hypothetical protein